MYTDAPIIGSGWWLYGMFFTAVGGLQTLACYPTLVYKSTDGKGLMTARLHSIRRTRDGTSTTEQSTHMKPLKIPQWCLQGT
eukprot:1861573-Prymnesium_polylepis.1